MFARFGIVTLLICTGFSVVAKEVAGVELEEVARLSVNSTQLVLNGSAVRREAQHTIYVGGLYLKEQTTSFDEIIADTNPKRFLFYCSTTEIPKEKLLNAWKQGFAINYPKEDIAKLAPMIKEFNKVWQSGLQIGDEVWVDYIPNEGTKISINGKLISEIPGTEFYHAFLKIWLGPHPFNVKMREALLGQ